MTLPTDLLDLAARIAREAGDLAARRRREGLEIATKSVAADIVTAADKEVEAFIRAELERERPDDGFYGEESAAQESRSGITWVVDPIDGTVNYAYGIPAWAVSIAAVEGSADPATWTAIAGVVYNPVSGEMFRASRGGGAWLAGDRLSVTADVGAAGGLVATGFGYDPATHAPTLALLGRVMPVARDIRRIGAASLDLASVASGRVDAYYEKGTHPWDHAAGVLLVEEAGGMVGGAPGGRPGTGMVIAAGPGFYGRIADILDPEL
ncbi:inositol monophosphatase [Microbacterium enclense]|uniref:Inositol-1-monophosphatase n=1 Tax=Microbacterium enclense TaxID=993073 RepID=A0A3S3MA15_9MICO|nr:inositol monophosphatase family protein [Microbacterium enclense]RWR16153.1 inositol monophosphatase [Microbacterium enclense]